MKLTYKQKKSLKENLEILALVFIIILSTTLAFLWNESLPTVSISNSTGECVEVVPDDKWSCENLPKKYHTVWVK